MANVNKCHFIGNLTRDPILEYLPSNTAVVNFGLGLNRDYKDSAGQKRQEVSFIDCQAFGKLGEILNKYCTKGSQVYIESRIKQESWSAQDGSKRHKLRFIVEAVQFLGGNKKQNQNQQNDNNQQDDYGNDPFYDDDVPF